VTGHPIKLWQYILVLAGTYLVAWTVSYVVVMGADFRYYVQYFVLAWTFNGFEIPAFIWPFSVVLCVPLTLLVVFLLKRSKRAAQ
jgi:hypothetical protein